VTPIDQSDDVVEFDESISTNLSKMRTYHMEFDISNVGDMEFDISNVGDIALS
jgi:hypothetical protein